MAKYVDIPLDKARRLRFTINAIRELERHFGSSFSNIFSSGNLGFDTIIMLLTVGLKYGETEKRALSDAKVGELVQEKWLENGKDMAELTDYIMEAMSASGIITREEDDKGSAVQPEGSKKALPNV